MTLRVLSHCSSKSADKSRQWRAWEKLKKQDFIFYISDERFHQDRFVQILRYLFDSYKDNQLFQVLSYSVKGFGFGEGSNLGRCHRNETSPLTQGLNYRWACDVCVCVCVCVCVQCMWFRRWAHWRRWSTSWLASAWITWKVRNWVNCSRSCVLPLSRRANSRRHHAVDIRCMQCATRSMPMSVK